MTLNESKLREHGFDRHRYETLRSYAFTCMRTDNIEKAIVNFRRIVAINPQDADVWYALSQITPDPEEKHRALSAALTADPSHAAARQQLIQLSGKVDARHLATPDNQPAPAQQQTVTDAQSFQCSSCGGETRFDPHRHDLICTFCGSVTPTEEVLLGEAGEQIADFVMPTTFAHSWANAQHRLICQHCGAASLFPPKQRAEACPYCGAHQLIESPETERLIDPHGIVLMRLNQTQAEAIFREWLGKGWFIPDDLKKLVQTHPLRPAYYPFWAFDGTLHHDWYIAQNTPNPQTTVNTYLKMFDDVLTPGLRAMPMSLFERVNNFNLKQAMRFDPRYLAGWAALSYDIPMSQASLAARTNIVQDARRTLRIRHPEAQFGKVVWTGITFKLLLLPLWTAAYRYKNRTYYLFINGQTGKIAGQKPVDTVKITLLILVGLLALLLITLLLLAVGKG
ncbi:MAG: hypothetical protein OHK0052_07920 [Anaerolineales bacterium]